MTFLDKYKIIETLNCELKPATGCTEPGAIAYASAVASKYLNGDCIEHITISASVNIIKNAISAGIPGTHYTGIEYASAIGAIGGDPDMELQSIKNVGQEIYEEATKLVESKKVEVKVADVKERLYIDVMLRGKTMTSQAVISGTHTNVVLIRQNGVTVYKNDTSPDSEDDSMEEAKNTLSVAKIYAFVNEIDTVNDPLDAIKNSIAINSAISEEGLKNDYGLKIGKTIQEELNEGLSSKDIATYATMVTVAGVDARMAGAPFTVVSNSGSGNQGIIATMPVVAAAKWNKADDDKVIRAVTLSNLIAIYIKSKFGRLSAHCGATVAGMGAATGITYLLGGGLNEVEYAIQNMIGNITGMLCDGAKADCSLKAYTSVTAAFQSAFMALRGLKVQKTDGIVSDDVEKSIDNFAMLGNKGSAFMDPLILDMMLHKD